MCGRIGAGKANGIVLTIVLHILSHVSVLSSLGTRVCTRVLFEPEKADSCEINGGSLCLPQQGHVSLAGRELLAAAACMLCSACSLSQGRWSAALWVAVRRLSACECDAC